MSIDPGLQPQRTALAWQRTGLSVLLACAAAGFAALRHGFPAAALCTFVAGVVLCHVAVRHFPKGLTVSPGPVRSGRRWSRPLAWWSSSR
ncbi:DUF202 domain-containing protein [Gordonia sp. QH-12]|uniref:DUF202 domain-containing protein n=1 Tax=Gordonia sp. QH-12 TaxID=1437876 RepID=UPI000A54370E|nr:DUF202 domain-containing protein [Gordonia sp. QH-12]